MWRASGLARKSTGPAMSAGLATRPSGIFASMRPRPSAANGRVTASVSTQPGAMLFTVMSRGPSSTANDLTKDIIAPFEAA